MKIIADSHIPFIQDYFGGYGELVLKPGRSISQADVRDADILLVRSITHVNENLLAASQVKFVGSVTAGGDHLDTKWLDEAGIIWSVAKGFNSPPVADYVVSTIAALQQQGRLVQKNLKAAVIGVGSAGRLVVDRMKSLNIDVTLCDPVRAQTESDFVSIALDDIADMDIIS
jgi:erythronate-4-phosphate dehydrogenase